MMERWLLAAFHLLALGIGVGAIALRAYTLGGQLDRSAIQRALLADAFWGVAALLWISTGLLRAFGGFEKGSTYYLNSDAFVLKMTLLALILVLEIWPMVTLIRWRLQLRHDAAINTRAARMLARISWLQMALVVLMVFVATALARGYGVQFWG